VIQSGNAILDTLKYQNYLLLFHCS